MIWVPWVLSGMGVFLALISLLRTFLVAGRDQSTKLHDDLGHVHERLSLSGDENGRLLALGGREPEWDAQEAHASGNG